MAKRRTDERLRGNRPAPAGVERGGQLEHTSPTPGGAADALSKGELPDEELRGSEELARVAQQGGSRGSHRNQRQREAESEQPVAGSDEAERRAADARASDPIRGPLPPDSTREDYLGGEKPHQTREASTRSGSRARAGRKRNEVT